MLPSLLQEEISGCLLFGTLKLYFTTLWIKEKEDDYYFKSEKLVNSSLKRDKNGSQLFES